MRARNCARGLDPLQAARAARADRGGVELELGPRKQRAVLALLLLNANRVVPSERLIDELWGDAPPETARSALQVYVSRLRKALGADGARLRTRSPGYVLDVEPGALDLDALHGAACGGTRRARSRLEPPRPCTRRSRSGAGRRWPSSTAEPFACRRRGPARGAAPGERSRSGSTPTSRSAATPSLVPELDALVAEHPYRERFRAQQMLALYRSGRQADALAAYRAGARGVRRGPRDRARADAEGARAAGARPGSGPRRSGRRRPQPPRAGRRGAARVWTAALLVGLAVATVAVVAALRDEAAPLVAPPNSVAVIDPKLEPGHGDDRRRSPAGADRRRGRRGLDGKPRRQDAHADRPSGAPRDRGRRRSRRLRPEWRWRRAPSGSPTASRARSPGSIRSSAASRHSMWPARSSAPPAGAVAPGAESVWAVFGDATLARVDPTQQHRRDHVRGLEADGRCRGRRRALGRQLRRLDRLPLQPGHLPRRPDRPRERGAAVDRRSRTGTGPSGSRAAATTS